MMELANWYNQRPLRANEIAERQGISLKYLEALLSSLKTAGLIVSERGRKGGYSLARPPTEINMYEVLSPLEDSLDIVQCTDSESSCERLSTCATRELWLELRRATEQILSRTLLADLAERQNDLASELVELQRETAGCEPALADKSTEAS
jgi:Rrf2 family protein